LRPFDTLNPIGPLHLNGTRIVPPLLPTFTGHLIGSI
jgi:hypothetical protein